MLLRQQLREDRRPLQALQLLADIMRAAKTTDIRMRPMEEVEAEWADPLCVLRVETEDTEDMEAECTPIRRRLPSNQSVRTSRSI